jgi:hypothetical protein
MRILLLFALVSVLLLAGCTVTPKVNANVSVMPADPNQPNTPQLPSTEDSPQPSANSNQPVVKTQPISQTTMLYCIMSSPDVTQEYWFTADTALLYTRASNGGWNKALINKVQSCGWDEKTRNCASIAAAGGFQQVYEGWKTLAQSLGECNTMPYDASVFQ